MRGTKHASAGLCPGQGNEARDGCPWMQTTPGWKLYPLLLVLAAHAWLGWTLWNFRPDGKPARTQTRQAPRRDEVLLVLEFKSRIAPARVAATRARRAPRRPEVTSSANMPGHARDLGAAAAAASTEPGRPLDLQLPPPPATGFAQQDLLGRAPALSFETTRYDTAWIPKGNLTHVVARRSQIAGAVLAVLGALREPCTEDDRRNYERRCVPDAFEYHPDND